jgi:hypothetical protein
MAQQVLLDQAEALVQDYSLTAQVQAHFQQIAHKAIT